MGVDVREPRRAGVVEAGERALAQLPLGVLVDGEQAWGQRGHHVGLLAHQLGRAWSDLPRRVIPNRIVYPALVLALAASGA